MPTAQPRPSRRLGPIPFAPPPPLLTVLLLAGALLALLPTAAAQSSRSVIWDRYDVAIDVRRDGTLHVVERQVVSFRGGPFSSGFADIPMARIDEIVNVRVREETADGIVPYAQRDGCCADALPPETYQAAYDDGFTAIRWGFESATNERRTFLVEYDAVGALRVYGEDASGEPPNQQLWWTAISREATELAPVRSSTVTVRLPAAVDPTQAVVGQGETVVPAAAHTTDGRAWSWRASDLVDGDDLVVRLQFPPLAAAAPPAWQRADDARRQREEAAEARRALTNTMFLGGGLLALVGGGIGLYGLWYLRGRDPAVGPIADFLPDPPSDLAPGAAGVLIGEVAHPRDIVATLVDLARRGVIAMEPASATAAGDVRVTIGSAEEPLNRFEEEVVRGLFGWNPAPGTAVRLWEISSRFAEATPEVRRRLYAELVDRGYFVRSPEQSREAWRDRALIAFLLILLGGGVAGIVWADGLPFYWVALGGVAALALALYLVSGALPRKTPAGSEAAARWRAFRRYLVAIDRYEKLDEAAAIFDRYLPYAVAFGLERSWVETFAQAGAAAPRWYAPFPADPTPDDASTPPGRGGWRDQSGDSLDRRGDSWWVVAGDETGADQGRSETDTDREGGGFHLPRLPDWQGTSDHAGRTLQGASNGLLSMFQTAGDAFASFAEAAASGSDDDGGSSGGWRGSGGGGGSSGSSSSRSSFSGGGGSGGSSGGGRRGFG